MNFWDFTLKCWSRYELKSTDGVDNDIFFVGDSNFQWFFFSKSGKTIKFLSDSIALQQLEYINKASCYVDEVVNVKSSEKFTSRNDGGEILLFK